MSIPELYTELAGDYAGTMSRLMKEDRIVKYLTKFTQAQDYNDLMANLEIKNYADAFRNVHTLKGVSLNLGLSKLAEVSSALTEALRNGDPVVDISGMVEDVKNEYKRTIDILTAGLGL